MLANCLVLYPIKCGREIGGEQPYQQFIDIEQQHEPDHYKHKPRQFLILNKQTASMPIMNRMDKLRIVSAKLAKAAPKPDTSVPIKVKLKLMPVTIAKGRNLPPAEPDITTGTSGRQHGFSMVTKPAIKIKIIEGAEGSMFFQPCI